MTEENKTENMLAVFDPIQSEMTKFAAENALTQFAYDTPEGNKLARAYCYKLRLVKGRIAEAHRLAKAEALRVGKILDEKKRDLTAQVDAMIEVHDAPLREIEQRAAKLAEEKRLAEEAEKARIEAERLAEIARKEAEAQAAALALRLEREAFEREKREAAIAEAARVKAIADAEAERKETARRHQEQIDLERQRIHQEREDAELRHKEAMEAEKAKAEFAAAEARNRAAEAERARVAAIEAAERKAAQAIADAEAKAKREREAAEQKRRDEEAARERAEAARILAENQKREQEARAKAQAEAEEARRVANKKYRAKVEKEAADDLASSGNCDTPIAVIEAIKAGRVRHVQIVY